MFVIPHSHSCEQEIKKSRFICHLFPVDTVEDAQMVLTHVQNKMKDATHHAYAYIIGKDGALLRYNDDKEPSQTAGVVIYDVLKRQKLTNIIAIVTRYYGGIKLGAKGLVRAYGSSVALALETAEKIPLTTFFELEIHTSYAFVDIILNYMQNQQLIEKIFLDSVVLRFRIPENDFDCIQSHIIGLTNNQVQCMKKDDSTQKINSIFKTEP